MKKRSWVAIIVIMSLLVGAMPPSFRVHKVYAARSTQELIREQEKEIKEIKDKIQDQKDDVSKLKKEKKGLQKELAELNENLTEVSEHLEDLEAQIAVRVQEIEQCQEELAQAMEREKKHNEDMEIRVRKMYERKSSDYVTSLMQAGSFAELLNLAGWFERVEAYDKDRLREYKDLHAIIENLGVHLEEQKTQLDDLKLQAEVEKSRVAGLISQVSVKISQYADQIGDAEKKALEYEQELKKEEEDLKALQKKLEEELRKSREAAQGTWRTISEVSFSDGDRKLLANIIYCEAGSEPYEGKLAVGAVVINRVLSSKFPDTVVGVVYQNGQFSPARSGRLELALASDKATAACYKAADEAMSGLTNVGTCVFFRTPVPGLTGINIGGHVFY